jgi:hypothetical protein
MSQVYLFRQGDGNEGNYPSGFVRLTDTDSPYAALHALVANMYKPGCYIRRFVMRETQIDGEAEFEVLATVYEGPEGEQAFGAAWLTAELEPYTAEEYESSRYGKAQSLRETLDPAAYRFYRKLCKQDKGGF